MTTRAQAREAKAKLSDELEGAEGVLGFGLGRDGEDWIVEVRVTRASPYAVRVPGRVGKVSVRLLATDEAIVH